MASYVARAVEDCAENWYLGRLGRTARNFAPHIGVLNLCVPGEFAC